MFRMTMLTFDILRRFEQEYKTDCYNDNERSTIETDARIAMMNRHYHHEQGETWTDDDIYDDFLRCLAIDKITVQPIETEPAEADETETNEQEETKMKNAEFIAALTAQLATVKNRSAWDRGVQQYAEDFAAELAENINGGYITLEQLATAEGRKAALLNGAKDWSQYSYGGSALIYDYEIAERLCNPSELKRTRNGERNPNSRETWLDCQARALSRASSKVCGIIRGVLYDLGMEVH